MAGKANATRNLPERFRPLLDQALTESELRYGGQEAAFGTILGQLGRDRDRAVEGQRSAHGALLGQLQGADTNVNRYYSDAGLTPSVLGNLAQDPTGQRLAGEMAGYRSQNQSALLGALAGDQFQRGQIDQRYGDQAQQFGDQFTAEQRERGTFTQSLLGSLIGDDRKARSAANAAARQQQHDDAQAVLGRDSAQTNALIGQGLYPDEQGNLTPLPGGKADPNAPGNQPKKPKSTWLPQAGQNTAKGEISKAVAQAKRLVSEGRTRAEAAKALTEGRPGQQVIDEKGNKINVPGVPSFEQLYASVALDIAFNKQISRQNLQALHGMRIKVGPLGYSIEQPNRTPNQNRNPSGTGEANERVPGQRGRV